MRRALGTGRWLVLRVGRAAALLTALVGVGRGVVSGHVMAWDIAWQGHEASALAIRPDFVPGAWGVGAAGLWLAATAGLLPTVQSSRHEVARHLS